MEIGNELPGLKLRNLFIGGLLKKDDTVQGGFTGCMQVDLTYKHIYFKGVYCLIHMVTYFMWSSYRVCEWVRRPPTLPTSTYGMRHEYGLKTDVTYLMPVYPTCVQHTAAAGTTGRLTRVSVSQVTPTVLHRN